MRKIDLKNLPANNGINPKELVNGVYETDITLDKNESYGQKLTRLLGFEKWFFEIPANC